MTLEELKKLIAGGLLSMLQYAEDFLRINSRHSWHKLARTRVEFVEYPERSVHEALVNAFIHRDYLVTGSEVHVDVFDDRIEITSPGGMPGDRKLEDFDIDCIPSIRRNPLLADMCERLRIMERRGSGFKKIFGDYAEDFINPGRRNPVLESRPAYFRIILPNMIYGFTDEQLIAAAKNPKARDATPVVTPVTTPVVPPVAPPVGRPSETLINEVQRKILQVLCNDILSTSELARKVGISQAKDVRRRYLRLLLDMGLVEYTIPNKPNSKLQQYRLTAKGSEFAERQDAGHVVNGVVNVVNDVVNRGKDVVNGVVHVVNETAIADSVLDALRTDSKISAMRIASRLGVATRTVQRALKALQDAGSIRRIGGTRGRWEVT